MPQFPATQSLYYQAKTLLWRDPAFKCDFDWGSCQPLGTPSFSPTTLPFFIMQSFLPSSTLPPSLPYPFLPCRVFYLPLPLLFRLTLLFKASRDFFLPLHSSQSHLTVFYTTCRAFFLPLPLYHLTFLIMQSFLPSSVLLDIPFFTSMQSIFLSFSPPPNLHLARKASSFCTPQYSLTIFKCRGSPPNIDKTMSRLEQIVLQKNTQFN